MYIMRLTVVNDKTGKTILDVKGEAELAEAVGEMVHQAGVQVLSGSIPMYEKGVDDIAYNRRMRVDIVDGKVEDRSVEFF